jgi:hypothetical protein
LKDVDSIILSDSAVRNGLTMERVVEILTDINNEKGNNKLGFLFKTTRLFQGPL